MALCVGAFFVGRSTAPNGSRTPPSTQILGDGALPDPGRFAPEGEPAFPIGGTFDSVTFELDFGGDPDPLPADIGVWVGGDGSVSGYGLVHTQDVSGKVLVASGHLATVADLFRVWGTRLDVERGCIGDRCIGDHPEVVLTRDGSPVDGDPSAARLVPGTTMRLSFTMAGGQDETSVDLPDPVHPPGSAKS
jgi:hypothetical protein